ncbi:MAG: endonuclease/exonuclease/phosphatase family protein [Pseudomonadota bacterium]
MDLGVFNRRAMVDFSCISWNIHRCRGNDGIVDPARTARVLAEEVWCAGTDALIFEEADEDYRPHAGLLDLAEVESITGLQYAHAAPDRRWGAQSHGFLGVIMFLAPSISIRSMALVDLPGRCHRGAVVAELERDGLPFRLIGTHLSLWQPLRIAQVRTISQHIFRHEKMPTVLIGDLNEWRPWGGLALSPRLIGTPFEGPVKPTFPIKRPFLPLDRALAVAPAQVVETRVMDGTGIRIASDHRPLAAKIALGY